jgi:hypothetical protein
MNRSLRRTLARLAIVCVLIAAPVATAGCGAAGHYVAGVIAHHVANHFAKTPAAKRRVEKAYCIYSVYRTFHDFRHHNYLFGALNLRQAFINCRKGFGRNQR